MKFLPTSFVIGEEIPVKLIGLVIILIIWGISSMVSAVNKAREQNRRRTSKLAKPVVAVRPKVVVRPPPLPASPASAACPRSARRACASGIGHKSYSHDRARRPASRSARYARGHRPVDEPEHDPLAVSSGGSIPTSRRHARHTYAKIIPCGQARHPLSSDGVS